MLNITTETDELLLMMEGFILFQIYEVPIVRVRSPSKNFTLPDETFDIERGNGFWSE